MTKTEAVQYGEMAESSCTVVVDADPDQDDCLAAAAVEYVSEHPELAGWDLAPRWTDETRETVALTIPTWAMVDDQEAS